MTTAIDIDELALDIVCIERVPMPLRKHDRVEAVRRLSAKGLQNVEIGTLLCCSRVMISRIQQEHGIDPAPPPWGWYALNRNEERRAAATARQKAYRDRQRRGEG